MDWMSFVNAHPFQPPQEESTEEGEEDNEDFYEHGTGEEPNMRAGAVKGNDKDLLDNLLPSNPSSAPRPSSTPQVEPTTTAEERRVENQKRLEDLRKQLLAKRQNASMKTTESRAASPANENSTSKKGQLRTQTPPVQQSQLQHQAQLAQSTVPIPIKDLPSSDGLSLDRLIEEGRAAAEAKKNEMQQDARPNGKISPASTTDATPVTTVQSVQHEPSPTKHEDTAVISQIESHPQQLADTYYADLAAWLDITGYHDVDYRNSKLRTYKERKALETEAARIAEKLEQLRKQEQEEIESLRSSRPSSQRPTVPPPALPDQLPSDDALRMVTVAADFTNGVKRTHSPSPIDRSVRPRGDHLVSANGFRIRGANDSPAELRHPSPPKPIEHRISYPDMRRDPADMSPHSRDPSLERRQAYYRHDGDRPPPPQSARPPARYNDYDTPSRGSRPIPFRQEHRHASGGYDSDPRPRRRSGDYERGQHYRGAASHNIRNGAQSGRPAGSELMY